MQGKRGIMARVQTNIRIAKVTRTTFDSSAEEIELDFELSLRQGYLLHAIEMAFGEITHDASSSLLSGVVSVSVHAETGTLETSIDAAVDGQILNSEIIAETSIQSVIQIEAATRGGSARSMTWLGPNRWNYKDMIGDPLLLATNLTVRFVTDASTLDAANTTVTFFYQYAELTREELAGQFLLRR
jgi:hypothetical protein